MSEEKVNWLDKLIIKGILKRLLRNLPENVNLKEVSSLNGLRTYAIMIVGLVYNILASQNIILPDALSQDNAVIVIDFILTLGMIATNYIGRKKIAATGKTLGY